MTTERSVRERFAIRVPRSADCALRPTDGELVRGLSPEVRPTTDLHLLDSERMTGNTKVGLNSPVCQGGCDSESISIHDATRRELESLAEKRFDDHS